MYRSAGRVPSLLGLLLLVVIMLWPHEAVDLAARVSRVVSNQLVAAIESSLHSLGPHQPVPATPTRAAPRIEGR